jgi:hypothetical protein
VRQHAADGAPAPFNLIAVALRYFVFVRRLTSARGSHASARARTRRMRRSLPLRSFRLCSRKPSPLKPPDPMHLCSPASWNPTLHRTGRQCTTQIAAMLRERVSAMQTPLAVPRTCLTRRCTNRARFLRLISRRTRETSHSTIRAHLQAAARAWGAVCVQGTERQEISSLV